MIKIKGFTLVEMIVSITLFAMIIVIAFDVMWNISISKLKLTNKLDVNQDIFVAIESIVNSIKDFGWDVDYEEYWNRNAIWISTSSGHYDKFSWYGNYWSGWDFLSNYWDSFYYCRSWIWLNMWTGGCLNWFNTYSNSATGNLNPQRFWEYTFQFIDYNSNKNDDVANCWAWFNLWDENCDWNIRWDEDDENIWEWPVTFSGNEVKEIYLIRKWKTNERLFIRWNIIRDPNALATAICNSDWTWDWCLWNIQILKLNWKDLWISHSWSLTSSWQYDWVIDTWQCSDDYNCSWVNNLPNSIDDWWVNLLPSYINVKKFKIFIYPNSNYKYAWKSNDSEITVNPYIRLNIDMWYSWERRRQLKLINPTVFISTSINLTKN